MTDAELKQTVERIIRDLGHMIDMLPHNDADAGFLAFLLENARQEAKSTLSNLDHDPDRTSVAPFINIGEA